MKYNRTDIFITKNVVFVTQKSDVFTLKHVDCTCTIKQCDLTVLCEVREFCTTNIVFVNKSKNSNNNNMSGRKETVEDVLKETRNIKTKI